MPDFVDLFATAATVTAATMTAANLGTRTTGWGFVVFFIGSIAWVTSGIVNGQISIAVTNGFLVLVNLVGIWRWLGRKARHEEAGAAAADISRKRPHDPTLFSGGQIIGAAVHDCDGKPVGKIIDTMLDCDTKRLSYVVIGQGGVGVLREDLRAIAAAHLIVEADAVRCNLDAAQFASLPLIGHEVWPAVAPEPMSPHLSPKGKHRAQDHQAIQI